MLSLGFDGFSFEDLYRGPGLARLHERFLSQLKTDDAALAAEFEALRAGAKLPPPKESDLLIRVGEHVSRFIGKLFGVQKELAALSSSLTDEQ